MLNKRIIVSGVEYIERRISNRIYKCYFKIFTNTKNSNITRKFFRKNDVKGRSIFGEFYSDVIVYGIVDLGSLKYWIKIWFTNGDGNYRIKLRIPEVKLEGVLEVRNVSIQMMDLSKNRSVGRYLKLESFEMNI